MTQRPLREVPQIAAAEAARLVRDGDVLMAGGFGMTGNPVHLLHALAGAGVRGLTYVGNNVGEPGLGGGRLLRNGQIARAGPGTACRTCSSAGCARTSPSCARGARTGRGTSSTA